MPMGTRLCGCGDAEADHATSAVAGPVAAPGAAGHIDDGPAAFGQPTDPCQDRHLAASATATGGLVCITRAGEDASDLPIASGGG